MTVQTAQQASSPTIEHPFPMVVVGMPAFNEERNIGKVIVNAKEQCHRIIVCDDGSSDDTGKIAQALGCKVVTHSRNRGYGSAIRSIIDTGRTQGADVLVTVEG